MSIKVSAIDAVGVIGKEWAQSVKRRPLEKGVARYVIDFLVLKGEEPENIGIYDLRKAAIMEIKCV